MTSRFRGGRLVRWAFAVVAMAGCQTGEDLAAPADLVAPRRLTVAPLNLRTVRIHWDAVPAGQFYRLERRVNLAGDFVPVSANVPQSLPGPVVYLDSDVSPETFYGYRVVAVDRLGNSSEYSAVAGARTPALPSIDVFTIPVQDGANLIEDPDGYTLVVAGPDTIRRSMSTRAVERIGPLRVGRYNLSLDGVASNCRPAESPLVVAVSDTGTNTVTQASFRVSCRDATRGEIVAAVSLSGEPPTGAQFRVEITGVASNQSLPASERAFSRTVRLTQTATTNRLRDLRPGDYQLELDSLPAACVLEGARRRSVDVIPLSLDTVRYAVRCGDNGGGGGGNANRPYVYRNLWAPQTAGTGATVELRVGLDLSRTPGAAVGAVEGTTQYDPQVLRFERIEAADQRFNVVGNGGTAGTVDWGGFTTTPGITGDVAIAKMVFTVLGANGSRAITRSTDVAATFFDFTQIDTLVRVVEDTLAVGAAQSNSSPTAQPNGPYQGAVGASIQFSSAGSADPDGTIVSFGWDFGDGTSGTGPSPTKVYQTAGTYTVRLTVTDDAGATGSGTTTATVGSISTAPPTLSATFGAFEAATSTLPLTLRYDLTGDVAATPGPEALDAWVIDSLKWDPSVLRFFSASFGPGVTGSLNATGAFNGRIAVSGRQAAGNSSGLITLGVIRFKVVGGPGRSTTTSTSIGAFTGTAATGGFAYKPLTQITEATHSIPGGGNPTGTVAGTITRSTGGAVSGATVTLTPGGSGTTNASGQYTIGNVAVGSGTVAVSNLPSGCTAPASKPYTIASGGQTVTVDFSVTCTSSAPTGTVSGTLTRSTGGAIAGATVTVTPGGSAATNANGQYSIGNVAVGSGTVAVSNLPSGCTAPASKPYTIASGGQTVTVDFSVTCTSSAPTGTVSGTLTRSTGGAIAGATVTVTPGGSAATNANGQYSIGNVAVGSGTVAVSNLPSGCTAPASKPYTIASGGQTVTVDFAVTCAGSGNSILGKWTVSGTTATLEIRANVVSGTLGSLEGTFAAGSARLQYTGASVATAPAMPNVFATNPPATTVSFGVLTTAAAGLQGDVGIIKLTFTIAAGAPATVSGTLNVTQAVDAAQKDVTPSFAGRVTVDPLTLP